MRKVALYCRVSTVRQDMDGYSIPMQKERLLAYCKAMGWLVAGVYVDPGHSGSTLDRPGMQALIEAVKEKRFDAVLVYKLDRLSRSQKDTLELIEDIFMVNGAAFVSMLESFDTTSIYGRAMLGILSVFAQMERETITERTLMGRAGRAEKGLFHGGGTDPIGYDYFDGELHVNEAEAAQVRRVYELFAAGHTVSAICRRMDGFRTKHGSWEHTSTVGNVLDNPLYAGSVRFDGVRSEGRHEAIIPAELDRSVKFKRERLRRVEYVDSPYLLTGMVFCAECGARYFANKRPNGSVVYSCHSRAKKSQKMVKNPNCKAPHIPVERLDAMVLERIRLLAEAPVEILGTKKAANNGGFGSDTLSEDLKEVESEIAGVMDMYQNNDHVDSAEVAARLFDLHSQRSALMATANRADAPAPVAIVKEILSGVKEKGFPYSVLKRRILLLQLIDGIHVSSCEVTVDWSFGV